MSRQIQIRRGTAAQHETFTGAPGELSFDFNTLRVHDGERPGGIILARADQIVGNGMPTNADYVTESQLPTAENNYTWYRKYASGWVEQGGLSTDYQNDKTILLPVEMQNTNYFCFISSVLTGTSNNGACTFGIMSGTKTISSFTVSHNAYMDWRPMGFEWCVKGTMAQN